MGEVQISEVHSKLIRSITAKEGITDYDITLNPGSIRGDNYLGVITTVTIKDRASTRELNFILKAALKNEAARKQTPVRALYLREFYVYEEIFKAYEELQKENNVKNPFKAYAECYGTCSEEFDECLVLKNMKTIGYKMWSRMEPMNAEHIAMVLTQYGKLHGVSMALKHKKPELYNDFKKNMTHVFLAKMSDEFLKEFLLKKFNRLAEDLKDNPEVSLLVRRYIDEKLMDFAVDVQKPTEFDVFTHGDCWNNNMLFKYEDEINPNKPTEMCLIDWQISHCASPIHDLAYFFLVCSPKEILNQHLTFLKIYYNSLSNILAELGCDPEKIMTYNQCEEQWKKYCRVGLHIGMTILKVMVSESEEALTIEEIADSGKDLIAAFDYVSKNEDIYKKRISDIVLFLHENDLLLS